MQNTQCLQAGDITPEGVTADFDKGMRGGLWGCYTLFPYKLQVPGMLEFPKHFFIHWDKKNSGFISA